MRSTTKKPTFWKMSNLYVDLIRFQFKYLAERPLNFSYFADFNLGKAIPKKEAFYTVVEIQSL